MPDAAAALALPPLPVVADDETVLVALPELPVLPDCADELLEESPELATPADDGLAVASPEVPPPEPPEVAVPVVLGFETLPPVFPPVEVEAADELPVAPDVADPWAVLLAVPEVPPVAIAVAVPEFPDVAVMTIAPLAIVSLDPLIIT